MKKGIAASLVILLGMSVLSLTPSPLAADAFGLAPQTPAGQVVVLDRSHAPLTRLTDGDRIQIRLTLPAASGAAVEAAFTLDAETSPVARCSIPAGGTTCESAPFSSLGWAWARDAARRASRVVTASAGGSRVGESAPFEVATRPVVLVHGFSASWEAWANYLGETGYLARQGVRGFAVGDGRAPGVLNTGQISDPAAPTNTIAQNAALVQSYIAAVKRATGAQMVDLMAHSMGGLISRFYIDRLMPERDVAQLIMLGSPNSGTDCANLPASLGFYLPASLEIRPSYVLGVFNQQITHRHGVQFYELAGVPILDAVKSPCTGVPTDIAVSLDSAQAVPLNLQQMPVLHTDLNNSELVFTDYVWPLLQKAPDQFVADADPVISMAGVLAQQFSRVSTGHLAAGASQTLTLPIDAGVSVASFALFDASRSLTVTVRGASGNVIVLDPVKNGLTVVQDPAALIYLGYGFNNPKPGLWRVTLQTTARTPPGGADYALTARFVGGARLQAAAAPLLPRAGETVHLTAGLDLDGQALPLTAAEALIRQPDGRVETLTLSLAGAQAQADWRPSALGLYGVDVRVSGTDPAGATVERTSFVAVEARPGTDATRVWMLVGGLCLVGLALVAGLVLAGVLARRVLARRAR
jgi:pimeloyl-ACP methyl ester carboxylesterase